jgi:hypothetical protein
MSAEPMRKFNVPERGNGEGDNGRAEESGYIDRLRDVLFGPQMRDYDDRLHRLDENLTRVVAEMRVELQRRMDAVEKVLKNEVELLTNRLETERLERDAGIDKFVQSVTEAKSAIELKVERLDEQAAREIQNLRRQLLDQSNVLRGEIKETQKQMEMEFSADLAGTIQNLHQQLVEQSNGLRVEINQMREQMQIELNKDATGETHELRQQLLEQSNALRAEVNQMREQRQIESNGHATDEIHELRQQLLEQSDSLRAEINQMREQMQIDLNRDAATGIHGLREQLLEQSNVLKAEIKQTYEQMQMELDREAEQIRGAITKREALAEMLSEVALRQRSKERFQAAAA